MYVYMYLVLYEQIYLSFYKNVSILRIPIISYNYAQHQLLITAARSQHIIVCLGTIRVEVRYVNKILSSMALNLTAKKSTR